jgi:RimJ/RimL family protein N-acetyltransferase
MKLIIETERLVLRPFTRDDAKFIVVLVNTPGWIEFIGDRNIKTEAEGITYLENGPMKSYGLHGFGLLMVELKDSKMPIGMCGLLKRETLDYPDIGFAFLPEYTGKGYAHEIVKATLTFAHEQLDIHPILAIVMPTNTRSIQLLEKVGMKFMKAFNSSPGAEELMLFSNDLCL